jgi:DNA/RNA-binding domain of Phe-tRNA-synthetase-like protein
MEVHIDPQVAGLVLGWVEADGLQLGSASPELTRYIGEAAARIARTMPDEGLRAAVRDLLRRGGFKPAGRNKPAQEYLLRTIEQHGSLPAIINAVDWLNVVSIESALPISLLSRPALAERVLVRYGCEGESFVFNASGQELDVQGLICVCAVNGDRSRPIGTPVKDSMAGKILDTDRQAVVCIYAPEDAVEDDELQKWTHHFAEGLEQFCGCTRTQCRIIKTGSDT